MNQGSLSNKKTGFLINFIANAKERKLISLFFSVAIALILAGIFSSFLFIDQLKAEDFHRYKGMFKQFGSISRVGFFLVLSIFPIFRLLRVKQVKEMKWGNFQLKTVLQFIGKLVRKWHAPFALVASGIVILHVYFALLRGFTVDFTYISGILTILVLPFQLYLGLMRYKRKDKNWHLRLAIIFLILFMVHASL